jgi:hypothetical protein
MTKNGGFNDQKLTGIFGDIMNGISICYRLFLDVETFNIAMENGLFLDVLPY